MKRRKSKKRTKRSSNIALLLFFMVLIFVLFDQFKQINIKETAVSLMPNLVSKNVQHYTPLLEKELKEVNLEEYTLVLAAIMQQESKGKGGDPMQASESAGLPPNSIQDPEQSIKQGVKHFQKALNYGSKKNVDFPAVIQAYNMGIGYIDFVAEQGENTVKKSQSNSLSSRLKRIRRFMIVETIRIISAIHTVMVISHIPLR